MKLLKKINAHAEEYLLVLLLASMTFFIFLQVCMRYLLNDSLSWTEELARYLFIWMVYIGISYGVKTNRHVKVEALLLVLSDKWKTLVRIGADVLFMVFCLVIIGRGFDLAFDLFQYEQRSAGLNLPMGYVYLAAPVGLSLVVIRLVQSILTTIRSLRNQDNEELNPLSPDKTITK
ncbi:TRAP transporter small permease [Terribacillus saccharophilus]|uniref:TRAP transporter small permease n=1 Tax=Terribacillus saccharophilus TaxID=361277 RepID=UPI0039827F3B